MRFSRLDTQTFGSWEGRCCAQRFLSLGLVDEIRLSIVPILLGDGLRLFGVTSTEQRWHLKGVVAYKTGFVELAYGIEPTNAQP